MTADRLARIMARHTIPRPHLLLVVLFMRGHPEQSITRALYDFVRGVGPAAVAAGRVRARVSVTVEAEAEREAAA